MTSVYAISNATGERTVAGFKLLDGDFDQVFPIGFEFHPVTGGKSLPA